MTGPAGFEEWLEPFESVVDSFGLSANAAINNAIHTDNREGLPADFPAPLYALALALGAVAAGAQKAAEFGVALRPYGFADEESLWGVIVATALEHYERKKAAPPDRKPN